MVSLIAAPVVQGTGCGIRVACNRARPSGVLAGKCAPSRFSLKFEFPASRGILRGTSRGHVLARCAETAVEVKAPTILDLELDTEDVKENVEFGLHAFGQAQLVIVSKVAPGSKAEEAGVRVGQIVKKISDPVRFKETWELNELSSLRFVRDAVRYRRTEVMFMVLEDQGLQMEEEIPENETVGEQLAREWNKKEGEREKLTAVQQRVKRRKMYMEESEKRDDGPFFAFVFSLFALPPLVILSIAYTSGYLDNLYNSVP